jgi:hypothetical protein
VDPLLYAVILNTDRRADTLACLESLRRSVYPNQRILVLDNASRDGSVQAIREAYPEVEIISLEANLGYAGNNNVGIREAVAHGADWILVLNEDTLLAEDCLAELVSFGEANPRAGVLGPLVYHFDEPGVIQSAGGSLSRSWDSIHIGQNEPDRGQYAQPRPVDWVSGCAILVRRGVIDQVGMLDERFFYYWEETEWCLRARRAGWQVWHVPQAKLWHKGVQRNYSPSPNVTYYNARNRLLMLGKHHAPLGVRLSAWYQSLRTLASWSLRPKWREMRPHRDALWQGMRDYLFHRWGMRRVK